MDSEDTRRDVFGDDPHPSINGRRGIIPRAAPWRNVTKSEPFFRQGYKVTLECGHIVYRGGGINRPAPAKCKCEICGWERHEALREAKELVRGRIFCGEPYCRDTSHIHVGDYFKGVRLWDLE